MVTSNTLEKKKEMDKKIKSNLSVKDELKLGMVTYFFCSLAESVSFHLKKQYFYSFM